MLSSAVRRVQWTATFSVPVSGLCAGIAVFGFGLWGRLLTVRRPLPVCRQSAPDRHVPRVPLHPGRLRLHLPRLQVVRARGEEPQSYQGEEGVE